MIKAELIQASNNLATRDIIFTFRLTYQRNSWLDYVGLSKYFEKQLTTTRYVTGIEPLIFPQIYREQYAELSAQIREIVVLVRKVFTALETDGHITVADVQKAINLFGPNIQNALKQYKPGECHRPFGDCIKGAVHNRRATESGWSLT